MYQKLLLLVAILTLIALPAMAQDDEKPTIAMMNFGYSAGQTLATKGAFDVLQAYGYFNAEERAVLDEGDDLIGENINVLWRNAGSDTPTANLMVEDALDRGVDAMLIVTTQVTQIAVNRQRGTWKTRRRSCSVSSAPPILLASPMRPASSRIMWAGHNIICPMPNLWLSYSCGIPTFKTIGMIVAPGEPISVSGARSLQRCGRGTRLDGGNRHRRHS